MSHDSCNEILLLKRVIERLVEPIEGVAEWGVCVVQGCGWNQLGEPSAPGNFDKAYGPLGGDMILAFTCNGNAHWFRIRWQERM